MTLSEQAAADQRPAAILRMFAALAPSGEQRIDLTAGRTGLVWLGDEVPGSFVVDPDLGGSARLATSGPVERLAAADELHRHERLLRAGWAWLIGQIEDDEGVLRPIELPLLSRPVALRRGRRGLTLEAVGDVEVCPLAPATDALASLEDQALAVAAPGDTPGPTEALQDWAVAMGRELGIAIGEITGPKVTRLARARLRSAPSVAVATGVGLYTARDLGAVDIASSLRSWAARPGLASTAFAALYASGQAEQRPDASVDRFAGSVDGFDASEDEVASPLPLSSAQRAVVRSAREASVTVVSGAPGNGKSHTLAAVAVDAIAAGRSVLIATQSEYAAEVLADLIERYPGPSPVAFGSSERRTALVNKLADGLAPPPTDRELEAAQSAVEAARSRRDLVRGDLVGRLQMEQRADAYDRYEAMLGSLRARAPGAFEDDVDPAALSARLDDLQARKAAATRRWWTRWLERRLRRDCGADAELPLETLRTCVDAAWSRRARATLYAGEGTRLRPLFDELVHAKADLAAALGSSIDRRTARIPETSRYAIGELATALRAGRRRRREMLTQLPGSDLTRALPLWVGTLRDIDDLLPHTAGLFDLVVLDEASQIDQPVGAAALLRARSAVIAGDPRQLRHVSFVSDANIAEQVALHGLDDLIGRLDVRRASVFDVAASASPVVWLDEHFRSVPHLIGFSSNRFYERPIQLVTRHPRNDQHDAIDIIEVDGARDDAGVNHDEVTVAVAQVRLLLEADARSVGIVSPMRAQADALESAVLDAFDLEEIASLGLRVGTVHSMQGNEREIVVVSLALGPDEPAASRRFVEDASLFNVMVTRARQRLILLHSTGPSSGGLIGDYLDHAARPPAAPRIDGEADGWAGHIVTELEAAGWATVRGYPVGRWTVDVCAGEGEDAIGYECGVHPDGFDAHIERNLMLRRAGWTVDDLFPTRFSDDPAMTAILLAQEFQPPHGR